MVQGPMGNCAKRPRHRGPKVGGLRGRSQTREAGLDPERVWWGGLGPTGVASGQSRGMEGLAPTTIDQDLPWQTPDSDPSWSWLLQTSGSLPAKLVRPPDPGCPSNCPIPAAAPALWSDHGPVPCPFSGPRSAPLNRKGVAPSSREC